MQAIQQSEYGGPEQLVLVDLPQIHPASGQVRIAVAVAGVHVVDTVLRQGVQRGPIPLNPLPTIPGREVAGTVDEVGDGVDPDWLGKRVVVHLGSAPGGYASHAVAAVEALHALPDDLDEQFAVALVATGRMTVSIADVAEFGPKDTLLLTGAGGGIGTMLIQIAKRAGAFVVGLASPDKLDRVRWTGADLAIDYTDPDWTTRMREALDGRPITVAIDGIGGAMGRQVLETLTVGGRFVVIGFVGDNPVTEVTTNDLIARGITASAALGARTLQRPGGLRKLEIEALELGASGAIAPLVDAYPLAEAAAAHRAIQERRTAGKVILVPDR